MLPFRLVYSEGYDLNLGAHVFQGQKYRMIHDRLVREGIADERDFIEPESASDEDILLVHEPGWVQRLKTGTLSYLEILKLEIPYSRKMVDAFWRMAGGSILAARTSLRDGIGVSIGGGFHHAFPDHGEGFCAIHDVAVAIRRLQKENVIRTAMTVDCDVHHGNGTAAIFAQDPSVFTFSIHQFNNYPAEKPPSSIDVNLADGVGDEEYLKKLSDALDQALARFRPDLIMYIAGADPYCEDQLGGLNVSGTGLMNRDRVVIGRAVKEHIPVAVTFAGGYAWEVDDTVTIHTNTIKVAKEIANHEQGPRAGGDT